MTQQEPFCGETLLKFSQYYAENIAGFVNISICIIGSISNIFNLLVFTRKNMISSVNLIFTHLALVDLIMLLFGIPSTWHFLLFRSNSFADERGAYEWLTFFLLCTDLMVMSHSISVWLTVMLAIWRYIAVVHPLKEPNWCNMKNTRYGIIIGYVLCIVLCVPFFFSHDIQRRTKDGRIAYKAGITKNSGLYTMIFINNGILFKLIPSVVLTIFSCRLIIALSASKKHHMKLTSSSEIQNTERIIQTKTKQQVDRSTRILLAVLALFLIAEVPLGVLGLMNVVYRERTHYSCYNIIGFIFDTVTLINTSITFVVYYTMSKQFRTTFKSLFDRSTSNSYRKDNLWRKISGNTIA